MIAPIVQFRGDYWFLSNFYPSTLAWEGRTWATVEHAFQASKTDDPVWTNAIAHARDPGEAKKLGRRVPLRPDWSSVRDGVMLGLLQAKFTEPSLREQLAATAPAELVEGNTWHDTYWGRCVCRLCGHTGENRLGQLLQAVRADIR